MKRPGVGPTWVTRGLGVEKRDVDLMALEWPYPPGVPPGAVIVTPEVHDTCAGRCGLAHFAAHDCFPTRDELGRSRLLTKQSGVRCGACGPSCLFHPPCQGSPRESLGGLKG